MNHELGESGHEPGELLADLLVDEFAVLVEHAARVRDIQRAPEPRAHPEHPHHRKPRESGIPAIDAVSIVTVAGAASIAARSSAALNEARRTLPASPRMIGMGVMIRAA